jgi:predicted permease
MNIWRNLRNAARAIFHARKLDAEMDEEMCSHIEMRTQANIEAGMNPEEARFAALRQFGWTESIKETCRDDRGVSWIENLGQDLRYGARMLRKNPGFTAVAVLTIALGICAATTQFSIFNGVLLHGLPFPEPDRLIRIALRDPSWPSAHETAPSIADFLEWQRQQRSCAGLTASDSYRWLNVSIEGTPRPLAGLFVTHNFFSLLSVRPLIGRDFSAADDRPGAERVALISHTLWVRDFGGVPDIVGRTLRLEGRVTTVIGVMPPGFTFPGHEQIWAPLVPAFSEKSPRGQAASVLARLNAGISPDQARAEFIGIARRLAQEFPDTNRRLTSVRVEPLHHYLVGGMRGMLLALLVAAIAVLVIACVNVMNLQFVRVSARMRELAMRGALGASRVRLLRQMLTEGMLLVLVGSAIGIALTHWTTQFLRVAMGQIRFGGTPGWVVTDIDLTFLAFILSVTAASILASSVVPALFASRVDAMSVLKEGAHGQSNRLVNRIGHGLVIAQISLTCALLIASLLQVKSITKHANVEMGFKLDAVMAGRMSLEYGYRSPAARAAFYQRFLREARANPEFTHVALTSRALMIGDGWTERFQVEGSAQAAGEEGHSIAVEYVSDGYFATLGLQPREGREFEPGERARGEMPALVNDTFARKHFSGASALSRRIRLLRSTQAPSEWRTIIGVVPDTHLQAFERDRDGSGVFLPMEESVPTYPTVVVRGRARADSLAEPLRRALIRLDPDLTLYGVGTPRANLLAANGEARMIATLSCLFAMVAGVLAAVGLYGVASFAVSQRTKDFGIRMALGADTTRIMGLVLRQGGLQLGVGTVGGLALALAFVQIGGARFEGFLYKVSPRDPVVYGTVILLLAIATFLACFLPARRAAKINPIVALRTE